MSLAYQHFYRLNRIGHPWEITRVLQRVSVVCVCLRRVS